MQYTYYSLPYAGKPEQLGSELHITGTDNYTKYLTENSIRVGGKNCLRGRNISLDRYFTSISIAEWCLDNNITITGTTRKDRLGVPKEMKTESGRVEKSTIWCYNNMVMVSYADKKKKGTKVVLFLSTMHDEMHISRDERKKPAPIVYYDHMKGGGVDVVDLLSSN